MRGYVNYYNLCLLLLVLMISLVTTQGRTVKHGASSVVVGFVYCDTKTGHSISGAGATVSMECNTSNGALKAIMKTNKHGEFKLPLGSSTLIKECQVKLLRSKHPHCASSSIRHVINQQGNSHVSSTFEPRKLRRPGTTGLGSQKNLLEPITNGPLLGPILQPIMPQLPPLLGVPSTPSFGFPGFPRQTPSPPDFPIPFPPRTPTSPANALP